MPRHVLYAYVDGYDLDSVAPAISTELANFVQSRHWSRPTWLVNQRSRGAAGESTDLPSWNLGLNHELPDPGAEGPDWFEPVAAIAKFIGTVSEQSGRSFVVGITDTTSGSSADLHHIHSARVDVQQLRQAIGGPPV